MDGARFLDVRDEHGARTNHLLHQVRAEGDARYVFLCNGRKVENPDVCPRQDFVVRMRGDWQVDLLDTATGEHRPPCRGVRGREHGPAPRALRA